MQKLSNFKLNLGTFLCEGFDVTSSVHQSHTHKTFIAFLPEVILHATMSSGQQEDYFDLILLSFVVTLIHQETAPPLLIIFSVDYVRYCLDPITLPRVYLSI